MGLETVEDKELDGWPGIAQEGWQTSVNWKYRVFSELTQNGWVLNKGQKSQGDCICFLNYSYGLLTHAMSFKVGGNFWCHLEKMPSCHLMCKNVGSLLPQTFSSLLEYTGNTPNLTVWNTMTLWAHPEVGTALGFLEEDGSFPGSAQTHHYGFKALISHLNQKMP